LVAADNPAVAASVVVDNLAVSVAEVAQNLGAGAVFAALAGAEVSLAFEVVEAEAEVVAAEQSFGLGYPLYLFLSVDLHSL